MAHQRLADRPARLPGPEGGTPGPRAHLAPLDGLRGLAVAAVLLFHAGRLRGGFLGVDLFFVLSGFLITGLLLEETGRHGRVRLLAFWGRRARRLLPALLVMGVAVLLLADAFGTPAQLALALDDAPWAAAQAVNWHFITEQVGYWDASDTRLYSHLWSIAVEWQFYLVWPLVVAIAGRGRAGRWRVAGTALAGALLSLVLMFHLGQAVDTTRAYEGTDTRAFALLLGAAAAALPVSSLVDRLPSAVPDALSALLLCGLVASWALTDGQQAPRSSGAACSCTRSARHSSSRCSPPRRAAAPGGWWAARHRSGSANSPTVCTCGTGRCTCCCPRVCSASTAGPAPPC